MSESETIGSRIAKARDCYHLTQARLAANVSVTRAAVSQYEKDIIKPRDEVIERLAHLFDVDPAWFTDGEGKSPDMLGAPLEIPEISLGRLTLEITDPLTLRNGRSWRLPVGMIAGGKVTPSRVIAIRAPNSVSMVNQGDRIVVDVTPRKNTQHGVFLVFNRAGRPVLSPGPIASGVRVIGRVIACLWTL